MQFLKQARPIVAGFGKLAWSIQEGPSFFSGRVQTSWLTTDGRGGEGALFSQAGSDSEMPLFLRACAFPKDTVRIAIQHPRHSDSASLRGLHLLPQQACETVRQLDRIAVTLWVPNLLKLTASDIIW